MFMHSMIPLTIGSLATLASAQQIQPAMVYTDPAQGPYQATFVNDAAGGLVAISTPGQRAFLAPDQFVTRSVTIFDPTVPDPIYLLTSPYTPTDGNLDDYFGVDFNMTESRILVGANNAPAVIDGDTIPGAGTAYLFDLETGALLLQLSPPSPTEGARFGDRVVLTDDYAVISDKTAVHLFDATTGEFLSTLEHISAEASGPNPADRPAWIAASGGFAAITYNNPNNTSDTLPSGFIGIYDLSTGKRTKAIDPASIVPDAEFTYGLSMQGPQIAFGTSRRITPKDASPYTADEVALYDFQSDQLVHLLARPDEFAPPGSSSTKAFGYAIDMDEQSILITEPTLFSSLSQRLANAYLYSRDTGSLQRVYADASPLVDAPFGDPGFGRDASLDAGNIFVGGEMKFSPGNLSGGTIAFDRETTAPTRLFTGEFPGLLSRFGDSIYAHNGSLVVTAPSAGLPYSYKGKASIFDVETGEQVRRMNPPLFSSFMYGTHIDGRGDLILIGAGSEFGNSGGLDGYAHLTSITNPDLRVLYLDQSDSILAGLGSEVAIAGNHAAIGNSGPQPGEPRGEISIYDLMTGEYQRTIRIDAEPQVRSFSRAMTGNSSTLFASSDSQQVLGFGANGRVFAINPTTGDLIATLSPTRSPSSGPITESKFGVSIDADDELLLVGEPFNGESASRNGATYLYNAHTLELIRKFSGPAPFENERFGTNVVLGEHLYAIDGRNSSDPSNWQAVVSVYDRATHALITRITYSPLAAQTITDLAFDGRSLFISYRSVFANQAEYTEPQILRFDIPQPCPGDANGDRTVDLADLNIVLAAFGQSTLGGPDLDGSGSVDMDDLNAILNAFGTTCD